MTEERYSYDGKIHDNQRLKELQALPLDRKIGITSARIIEWYTHWDGQVYIAFSGGKDSTVLLDIARKLFPDIEAVFVNTGLEYPEIQTFAKSFDNVTVLRPKLRFDEVIKKYGYPMLSKEISDAVHDAKAWIDKQNAERERERITSQNLFEYFTPEEIPYRLARVMGVVDRQNNKRLGLTYKDMAISCCKKYIPLLDADFNVSPKCCNVMKKEPSHSYAKKTGKKVITGNLAEESKLRKQEWLESGCNAFNLKTPVSTPLAFWTEQDILEYIYKFNLPIAKVYGEVVFDEETLQYKTTGDARTGCVFCGFGAHKEKDETRFQRLQRTHPNQYNYCLGGGEYDEDGIWRPNKDGLGMKHVFDELNKIYGENFIRYENKEEPETERKDEESN